MEPIDLDKIWADQLEFNNQFRTNPAATDEERTRETKELVLHLFSECDELLRASGAWKLHRRVPPHVNPRAVKLELVDVFKYWMSICQVQGFSPEEMLTAYWEKSMVVRQRYSEEFVQALDQPYVVIDIDNVLADYIRGFVDWAHRRGYIRWALYHDFMIRPRYVDAGALGMTYTDYEKFKHEFRVSGQHAQLPLRPDAAAFLQYCTNRRWAIVLLTSRPIDRYPNLYSETMMWLHEHRLPYNFVWWSSNKAALCADKNKLELIQFAVDDEWQYVRQFNEAGIPVFWLNDNPDYPGQYAGGITRVTDLHTLTRLLREMTWPTKTQSTDHTLDTPAKSPETSS